MQYQEIYEKLKEEFADDIIEFVADEQSEPVAIVNPARILDIGLFLRDDDGLKFDYLALLSGMDYKENFGLVYHYYSYELKHRFVVKVILDKSNPKLPSVERVWKTANWHEREAWDMYGIVFEGHPNLIRILTPYDWEGHPLRKDYKTPELYHDIKVPY